MKLCEPTALAAGCSFVACVKLYEPTALAAGCSFANYHNNSGPKLALTIHKVSAIWHKAKDFLRSMNAQRVTLGKSDLRWRHKTVEIGEVFR